MMTVKSLAYVDGQAVSIRDMPDLLTKLECALTGPEGFTLYTLNLDHLVKRRRNQRFRALYSRATFVTADGWPVVTLARRHAPGIERTTGADLVVPVCRLAARLGTPIALFGSSQTVLDKAATRLGVLDPELCIKMREAPAHDFDPGSIEADDAIARIQASGARLCFVALGAPKQEMFCDRAAQACPHIGFLSIGAALDFLAGAHRRAPHSLQKLGLEWAWRLMLQPRRLGARYARCGMLFLRLLMSWERAPVPVDPRSH